MRRINHLVIVHLALLVVGLIYGANYSIAKISVPEYVKPYGLIVVRVGVSTILFWILSLLVLPNEKIRKADFVRLIACAIFGVVINQLMFFKGLSMTSTISASLIMTVNPIIVLTASYFILHERVTPLRIFGVLLGSAGSVLLILRSGVVWDTSTFLGDFLIFINAVSYGLYLVLVKPLMLKYRPITIIKWIFSLGLILIIPVGWSEFREITWTTLPQEALFSVAYIIIGTTLIAYLINIWSMKYVSPTVVGYYIYAQPLFAGLISLLFLDEGFGWKLVASAVLIFTGVFMVNRKS